MGNPYGGPFVDFAPMTRQIPARVYPPRYLRSAGTSPFPNVGPRVIDRSPVVAVPPERVIDRQPLATSIPPPPASQNPAPPPAAPSVASPPVAVASAPVATYAELPTSYLTGLGSFVGSDPSAFYTSRGAEQTAQRDYYNMLNMWQDATGVPLTSDDWPRVWAGLNAYRTGYAAPNRAFTVSDAYNYLRRMLASAPRADYVSYLRTGEI